MINITFTPGNAGRKNVEAKATDTVKSVFERLGVKCEHGTTYINSNQQKADDVYKTFADLGVTDDSNVDLKLLTKICNA